MAIDTMFPSSWTQTRSGSVRIPGTRGFVSRAAAIRIVETSRRTRVDWFLDAGDKAAKAILKSVAENVVEMMKEIHRPYDDTGRLTNSIHATTEEFGHYTDYDEALNNEISNKIEAVTTNERGTFVLYVGSWLPYACVEVSGRRRDFIHPAIDTAASTVDQAAQEAFREAGLF